MGHLLLIPGLLELSKKRLVLLCALALLLLNTLACNSGGGDGGSPPSARLSVAPASVSFGGVAMGSSGSSSLLLTNTGTASLNISQVNVSGSGFAWSGFALPLTLVAGQSTTLTVTFSPANTGSATGSLSIVSNASGSPATVPLSGTGLQASSTINLAWDASTSVVAGYFVYRGTQAGGPYTRLNPSPVTVLTYSDATVTRGTTYFYVVTAVNDVGFESVNSNEVSGRAP